MNTAHGAHLLPCKHPCFLLARWREETVLFFITVPYPKPFTMARPAIFSLSHDKPCLTISLCLAALCSQLCPNTKDTMARAWHPEGCTWSRTEHTCQICHVPSCSHAPCCHLANSSHQRSWQTHSSALDGFIPQRLFLHSKYKAPTKNYSFSSRATDSYALAQVTASTTST